jgi:hypothetical protein
MAARAKLQNEIHDFGWCKKVQVGSTSDYLNNTVQEVKGRKHVRTTIGAFKLKLKLISSN